VNDAKASGEATWHWAKVRTELNRMRATMLLAEVHALLGFGQSAPAYAEERRNLASTFNHVPKP
jgi:hypothetical protein